MTRQRRSLWGLISHSKKVNALSSEAVILYTFTMAHLDDFGYIEGDPRILKGTSVPMRDDIPIEKMPALIDEILTVHQKVDASIPLWIKYKVNGEDIIFDPYFDERQSFHGIKRQPSRIKELLDKQDAEPPGPLFNESKE
jgi:hypothetical protein